MLWISIVLIIESIFKLLIAISLAYFIQTERLIYYGFFTAIIAFVSFLLYGIYCLKKYKECIVTNYQIDKSLMKEIGSFAGWSLGGCINIQCQNTRYCSDF